MDFHQECIDWAKSQFLSEEERQELCGDFSENHLDYDLSQGSDTMEKLLDDSSTQGIPEYMKNNWPDLKSGDPPSHFNATSVVILVLLVVVLVIVKLLLIYCIMQCIRNRRTRIRACPVHTAIPTTTVQLPASQMYTAPPPSYEQVCTTPHPNGRMYTRPPPNGPMYTSPPPYGQMYPAQSDQAKLLQNQYDKY